MVVRVMHKVFKWKFQAEFPRGRKGINIQLITKNYFIQEFAFKKM